MGKPSGEVASRHLILYFPMHVLPAHTSAAAHPERGLALVAVCCCMLPAWALALWPLSLFYQYLHSKRNTYIFLSCVRIRTCACVCMYKHTIGLDFFLWYTCFTYACLHEWLVGHTR